MTMSEPVSTGGDPNEGHLFTLSAADSLANLSALRDSGVARTMPGGSGRSSAQSFATYDQDSQSWRTSQGSFDRRMGEVLGDLAACGYDAEWDCLPAAAFGAPHQRDRVFAVAYPSGERQEEVLAAGREPRSRFLAEAKADWGGHPRRGASGRVRLVLDASVFGVADGFPTELDQARLHALGNAVVPQVSEHIGRLIMSAVEGGATSP